MIEDECLDGVSEIYALWNTHLGRECTVSLKSGELMAGATDVDIEVIGLGGHASEPANAIDPITALCHIHVALHSIKTALITKEDWASLSFGLFQGGTSRIIIPQNAILKGKIRWFTKEVWDKIAEWIRKIASSTAEAFGCTASCNFNDNCPPLVNPQEQANSILNSIIGEYGKENINDHIGLPLYSSDDFSLYLEKIPGCLVLLNNTSSTRALHSYMSHNPEY